MEFLRFQTAEPLFVPSLFKTVFVPSIQFCHAHAPLSDKTFERLCFPLAEHAAHVSFSLASPLPGSCAVKQVHSATVLDAAGDLSSEPADGLFFVHEKNSSRKILSIRTADCLPVVLVAHVGEVTFGALVHAGWRGFAQGIHLHALELLVQQAELRGIKQGDFLPLVKLFLGPAIFGASYECGEDVASALQSHYAKRIAPLATIQNAIELYRQCSNVALSNVSPVSAGSFRVDRVHPDLQLLACVDLASAGVLPSKMLVLRENTWGSPILHSYRFASVHSGAKAARIVSHLVLGSSCHGVA